MPWRAAAKAREKMPAEGPALRIGVAATVQERPRSLEWKTRAAAGPPVANHASRLPNRVRQLLLAAHEPSLGSAGGGLRCCHVGPPSSVVRTSARPSSWSPATMPCCASQKAMASKKPLGSGLVNRSVQCSPASLVLRSEEQTSELQSRQYLV